MPKCMNLLRKYSNFTSKIKIRVECIVIYMQLTRFTNLGFVDYPAFFFPNDLFEASDQQIIVIIHLC